MKKQNFLKGSIILMASAVIAKALGAVFKIPLTNILGGVGMGYFSCAYSIFMPVYALVVTGISSAVTELTAKSAAFGLYRNAARIRSTALMVFSAVGVPASVLIFLLAKPLSVYSVGSGEASVAVAMIAPSVFFGCITAVERGYSEGMSNMYPTAVSQVIEGIVKVFAGLFLCRYTAAHGEALMRYFPGVSDVRAVSAAAGILGVTLSSVGAVMYLGAVRLFSHIEKCEDMAVMSRRTVARELMSRALPVGASAVVTNLTALIDMWTVIWCISRIGDSIPLPDGISRSEMPQFVYGSFAGIALTVFNLVPSVTNMLGKGALTCTAAARERCDADELRRSTMQALFISSVIAIPSAVGIGVLSPEILGVLFPRQTDEVAVCVNALRLLMPGMLCLCVAYPLFSMIQAIGKPSAPLKIMLLGTAVKLAGNLLLIPLMGVDGAAVSTSVCYAVILVTALRVYIKASGVKLEAAPFLKTAYAGALCGASAYLASSVMGRAAASGLLRLSAAVCAGGAVYAAALGLLFGKKYSPKRA